MTLQLQFGLTPPESATAAWGARWIVTQAGDVDELWDRTATAGDDEPRRALLDHLQDVVKHQPHDTAGRLLREGTARTREKAMHRLYEDDAVIVDGDCRASCGYMYVVAYPKER